MNCGPFFGNFQPDSNVEQSHVGNFFRAKADFFDQMKNEMKKVIINSLQYFQLILINILILNI